MKWETVNRLDQIRGRVGFPLIVNSGVRTPEYNATVGGVDGSAHEAGWAADLAVRTSQERFKVLKAAMDVGFKRIGVAKTFIHLDADPSKPPEVAWLY